MPLPLPPSRALYGLRVGVQAVLGPSSTPFGGDVSHALWWELR